MAEETTPTQDATQGTQETQGTTQAQDQGTQAQDTKAQEATPERYTAMDWRNLPDLATLRTDPKIDAVLKVYPDMGKFIEDSVGWRSEMSRRVRLPNGENTKPEDWQRFWQQLPGYPKDPKGYQEGVKLPSLGKDPDGNELEWDGDLLASFYETAHSQGLTSPQAQAVLDVYARALEQARNVMEAQEAQETINAELELQKRFGASLPRKLGAARNYFMRSTRDAELGNRIWAKVEESGLGDDPDFIEFYSMQYERFGEPLDLLNDHLFSMTPTMEEIGAEKEKVLAVVNDPKKPAAERDAAFQKLNQLNRQLSQLQTGARR